MKIICIGRNYAAHVEELDNERPVFEGGEVALGYQERKD